MDSPVVMVKNSSGFLSIPPRLELFLPMLLLQHQILSPETLQLLYSLILVAFFSKKCPTVEYAQLYKKNTKKRCGFSQRCVLLGIPKICFKGFSSGIHQNIQKNGDL